MIQMREIALLCKELCNAAGNVKEFSGEEDYLEGKVWLESLPVYLSQACQERKESIDIQGEQ